MDHREAPRGKPKKKPGKPIPTPPQQQAARSTHRRLASRIQKPRSARSSPNPSQARKGVPAQQQMTSPTQIPVMNEALQGFHSLNLGATEQIRPHSWSHSRIASHDPEASLVADSSPLDVEAFPPEWPLVATQPYPSAYQISPEALLDNMTETPRPYYNLPYGFDLDQALEPFCFEAAASVPQGPRHAQPPLQLLFDFNDPSQQPMHAMPDIPLPELSFDAMPAPEDVGLDPSDYQELETPPVLPGGLRSPDEELVGVGIHDKAADTARQHQQLIRDDTMDLSSGLSRSPGKGLKLEETWQPPPQALPLPIMHDDLPYGSYDALLGGAGLEPYLNPQLMMLPPDVDPLDDFPLYFPDGRLILGDAYAEQMLMAEEKPMSGQPSCAQDWQA